MTNFQQGDKVRVVRPGLHTYGKEGTITRVGAQIIEVYIGHGFGILTYSPKSLKLINKYTDNNDNNKGENNMLMGNYQVCKIRFVEGANTSKEYHYALYDRGIGVGDYVVVKSARHGMGIATIIDIIPDDLVTNTMRDYCNEGREVVSMFDMSAYEERVEKRKQAKKLKEDMNKKMKEMQELAMFELMAEKNPELKEMLDTYKELTK